MKILHRDKKQGIIRLKAEGLDDLWVMHTVIGRDDLVSAETERKIKIGGEESRNAKVVRKKMFLTIRVEQTEFAKHSATLRISGAVFSGPDDISLGSYHTINVEPGSDLKIKKDWKKYELQKLDNAVKASGKSTIICVFDRENAVFAKLDVSGVEKISELKGNVEKKVEGSKAEGNFYKQIADKAMDYQDRIKPAHIIFASPGFYKEYLQKELPTKLSKIAVFSGVSDVSMQGITEVLKRPELSRALQEDMAAQEEVLIQELLLAINKEKASIGTDECYDSINSGRCTKFLVSENLVQKLRQENKFKKLENMMLAAEQTNAEVHLIGSSNAAKQLDGIGGLGCINRW